MTITLDRRLGSGALPHWAGMDVWQLLKSMAAARGDAPALIWQPYGDADNPLPEAVTLSYAELLRRVSALAAGLQARGVEPGQTLVIHLENCPEFVMAWYACAAVGAIAVTTNTRSSADEMDYFIGHCGAVAAITQSQYLPLVDRGQDPMRWVAVTDPLTDDQLSFDDLAGTSDAFVERRPDPTAPMSIQYTSGTTSRPKGVLWTHANALWAAKVNAVHEALMPSDRQLVYMPLFHTNALGYSMLASLYVGAAFVLVPKWSTSRFWDTSLRHGCTWLSLMTLSLRAIAQMEIPQCHRYRLFGTGIADTPLDAMFGVKTIGWFGMTETVSHPIIGDPYAPNRPMSMGRPAPEYRIKVVAEDGVTPVGIDEPGELLVLGEPGVSLFHSYYKDADATAAAFDDEGWFHTGDLVTVHADGHLSYSSRAKDMLKVGAENVAASEIESVIMTVGGITEAAVVGRPDEMLDEVPVAFVVADPDNSKLADRVIATCADKLANFKVPREIFIVAELPRSTLNKAHKLRLKAWLQSDTPLEAAVALWLQEAKADPSGDTG